MKLKKTLSRLLHFRPKDFRARDGALSPLKTPSSPPAESKLVPIGTMTHSTSGLSLRIDDKPKDPDWWPYDDWPYQEAREKAIELLESGETLLIHRRNDPKARLLMELERDGHATSVLVQLDEQSSELRYTAPRSVVSSP